jgi:hypothetical protein
VIDDLKELARLGYEVHIREAFPGVLSMHVSRQQEGRVLGFTVAESYDLPAEFWPLALDRARTSIETYE